MMDSGSIREQAVFYQDPEPSNPPEGALWVNPTAGSGGNNVERYVRNDNNGWDLTDADGPDTPSHPSEGAEWTTTQGGQSDNNVERYVYRSGSWEVEFSVGPDTPSNAANGGLWRDTANGQQKVYDGNSWANVGVTDHSNLSNVSSGQHHAKTSQASELSDVSPDSTTDAHHAEYTDSEAAKQALAYSWVIN